MENCSSGTTAQLDTLKTTGFLAFRIVMLITAVAAIFFNILTAVILSTRKEVLLPIRILLVNLLAGIMFTAVAMVMQSTDSAILASNSNVPPAEAVFRVYIWFFRSSAVVRLCNLAAYSIAVVTVVKRRKHLKPVHTLPAITITWLYALLVSIPWVIPSVSLYTYNSDVQCASQLNASSVGLKSALLTLWIIAGGIIPTIICIAVIIAAFCYIRKLQVSEVTLFKKGLVRLALFLFLANVSNLINMIVPPILVHLHRNMPVTSYLISSLDSVMLWSTALVLVIFIQPVKAKVVAILCCSWCKQQCSSRLAARVQAPVPSKEVTLLDSCSEFGD